MSESRTAVVIRGGPNVLVSATVGAVCLGAGVVALAVTVGADMATAGDSDGGGVSLARAGFYLAVGAILLFSVASGRARAANSAIGASYLVVGVALELLADGGPRLLTLNHADNVVHLVTAALLLGFGRTQD